MTPLASYQQKLSEGIIEPSPEQEKAIEQLQAIYLNLMERQKVRDSQIGQLRRKIKPRKSVKGLYLYGSVGIGKSFLMDTFYDCLPVKKMRLHFHAFMQKIHQSLREKQGEKNPLQKIAQEISNQHIVICFDEFFVSDIADAMILGELFKALFKGGICLVTTSNISPDDLYKNGIQRERFLTAIDILKKNVTIQQFSATKDFRRQHHSASGTYHTPLDDAAEENLANSFRHFSHDQTATTHPIEILGRSIELIQQAGTTIWLDFYKICGRPRSQNDYLALIEHYDVFLISHVPIFDLITQDLLVSFIHLVDILYDHQKQLILSAEAQAEALYHGEKYQTAFNRTVSRLIEMQSADYPPQTSS
jgi:cell division protein ZapE